jgi:hypothetical protein
MNVFELRDRLVGDYGSYTRSFIKIADRRISEKLETDLNSGAFRPEPMLQLRRPDPRDPRVYHGPSGG